MTNPGASCGADALNGLDALAARNDMAVADNCSPAVGLPAAVLAVALKRQAYGIRRSSDGSRSRDQQHIADTFFALGLLPKAISVSDATEAGFT